MKGSQDSGPPALGWEAGAVLLRYLYLGRTKQLPKGTPWSAVIGRRGMGFWVGRIPRGPGEWMHLPIRGGEMRRDT